MSQCTYPYKPKHNAFDFKSKNNFASLDFLNIRQNYVNVILNSMNISKESGHPNGSQVFGAHLGHRFCSHSHLEELK